METLLIFSVALGGLWALWPHLVLLALIVGLAWYIWKQPPYLALLMLLAVSTPPATAQTPPPAGTWAQIPNTALYPAVAPEAKPESAPGQTPELWSPQGLFAYSGTELATVGGKLGFVLWGGGDGDSANNQLLFTPFDGSGPRALSGPYLAPDKVYVYPNVADTWRSVSRNAPGSVTVAAAPKSRHTYRSFRALTAGGKSFLFNYGGALWMGGGTNVTRTFDLSLTFAQAMARPDMGWQRRADAPEGSLASASGWDAQNGVMVTRGRSLLSTYDPVADVWIRRATPGGGSDFQSGVGMDVPGRTMYVLAGNLRERINLDTYAVTPISASWTALLNGSQGPGVAWHQASRRLILWLGGQTLYRIDPVTNTAEQATMGGLAMPDAPGDGTYGSFDVRGDTLYFLKSITANVMIGTIPSTWMPWGSTQPPPPPVPLATVALTASPSTIAVGQSSLLTLLLPTLDYHNVFINNVRPTCGWSAAPVLCAMTVSPSLTTTYQAVAINSAGVPYTMPRVTVTIQTTPPVAALTANPAMITSGQGSLLTLSLPSLDYHNIFINGVRPACVVSGSASQSCTLGVVPPSTTLYQAVATNSLGTPYTMPRVTVTVSVSPPPPPPPGPTPPPSTGTIQVPAGQPIPARQWVERRMPATGKAFMGGGGGKHGRAFYHPGLKGLVFAGGDWRSSMSFQLGLDGNGEGSEIWTLNALTDMWTLLRPLCVPGAVQPGRPDSVNWAYDSKRDQGLMAPGFYFISQGGPYANGPSRCGAVEALGGYAFSFATRQFTGPDGAAGLPPPPGGWGGDGGSSYASYDPRADEFCRVRNAPQLECLNLAAKTWRVRRLQLPAKPNWNPVPNRAQSVIDVQGRALYWVDTFGPALVKVDLASGATTAIPLPAQHVPAPGDADVYLAFDPINRVVIVPNNESMGGSPIRGLEFYWVDTGQWEWQAVPTAVWGSVWGFDENVGALIGIGKRAFPTSYYLYKVR